MTRWANRLAAMDSARIDTIHGLCASILRANAAAANVDPAFTVLDEIEARVLIDTAIDDVLRALDSGDPVLELFTEYGEREIRATLRHVDAARTARRRSVRRLAAINGRRTRGRRWMLSAKR